MLLKLQFSQLLYKFQMNITKIIQTTKGPVPSPFSSNHLCQVLLFHQNLSNYSTPKQSKIAMDLQNIRYHIHNPWSQENTTLSGSLIQHQIVKIITQNNIKIEELLIMDGSDYRKKVSQIFEKYYVIKGFNYRLNQSTGFKQQERKALLKKDYVLKQIQFEFKIGNQKYKPGFIGQIYVNEFSKQDQIQIFQAYLQYSSKTQCPILMNFLSEGQQCLFQFWKQQDIPQQLIDKIKLLQNLLKKSQTKNATRLVIYNLPFVFVNQSNIFRKYIVQLTNNYKFYLGFDILRYTFNYSIQQLQQIIWFLKHYPDRILLSSGIKFKTDTKPFGGEGLNLYKNFKTFQNQSKNLFHISSTKYIIDSIGQDNFKRLILKNGLFLMDWKQKHEEIKIQILWKCDNCTKENPQSLQSFRKFGKQFCSIKCLKQFKF